MSIPTDDFLDVINEFPKEFEQFFSLVFFWNESYQFRLSEILTKWGLCFTYNIAFSHDLLNLNFTSHDFHYQHTFRKNGKKSIKFPAIEDFPKRLSTSDAGLWVGFGSFLDLSDDFDGFPYYLHDSFELPYKRSKTFKADRKLQSKILIEPQIYSIDESLYDFTPAE